MRRRLALGVASLVIAAVAFPAVATAASTTFPFTGREATYTVPLDVNEVQITAISGAGGGGCLTTPGGAEGSEVTASIPVNPGEDLYIEVGGPGGFHSGICAYGANYAGWNGGGLGGPVGGGGGGGASDVRSIPRADAGTLASRILVAGGGGGLGGGATENGMGDGTNGTGGSGGWGGARGGFAGTSNGTNCGGVPATSGAPGVGGNGDDQTASYPTAANGGGGGGGGGYYGGGGGGACSTSQSTGGGGGTGSSYVTPTGVQTTPGASTSQPSAVIITPVTAPSPVAALSFSPTAGLDFPGTQTEQTLSAPQMLTVTDTGAGPLDVSGLTLSGADAQDFLVSSNGCLGTIGAGASCTVGVSFAPQGAGARAGTLQIASNDPTSPASVPLSGTGAAPASNGTSSPAGVQQGPRGPAGPAGPAGKVELVTCHTVTTTVTKRVGGNTHTVHHSKETCKTRLVSGTVKVAGSSERASISRAGVVYASGTGVLTAPGRLQLILSDRRTLRPGRYTLKLTGSHGHRTRMPLIVS
jgi:hypothetical protein